MLSNWILRSKTCKLIFVSTLVMSQLTQRPNIASCFGFRESKQIPQNVGFTYNLRIPLIFCGFRSQLRATRQPGLRDIFQCFSLQFEMTSMWYITNIRHV